MKRDLTEPEFRQYQAAIEQLAGIHFPPEKRSLLSNRVKRRLRATGAVDYQSYLSNLRTSAGHDERQRFLDSITTTETYFYRCQRHWEFFAKWLRDWAATHPDGGAALRIWSAAAATGAEAYTALICAREILGEDFGGHDVQVLGTDLNRDALEFARAGRYGRYAVAQMDESLRRRYFEQVSDGEYQLDAGLAAHAEFRAHNLVEPLLCTPAGPGDGSPVAPREPAVEPPFDLVLLRNVLVHLAPAAKQKVLGHVRAVLRPGGYLITGDAESLLGLDHGLDYVRPSLFVEPLPAAEPA